MMELQCERGGGRRGGVVVEIEGSVVGSCC